jgi:hypothetical protein
MVEVYISSILKICVLSYNVRYTRILFIYRRFQLLTLHYFDRDDSWTINSKTCNEVVFTLFEVRASTFLGGLRNIATNLSRRYPHRQQSCSCQIRAVASLTRYSISVNPWCYIFNYPLWCECTCILNTPSTTLMFHIYGLGATWGLCSTLYETRLFKTTGVHFVSTFISDLC